ncbi:MAG: hypothetical protein ACXWD4_14955, partial [Bacteroidia bacterium]
NSIFAQTKEYYTSDIAKILLTETQEIGVKLLKAEKENRIAFYRTDSLDKTFTTKEFKREITENDINGLTVIFKPTSAIESHIHSMEIVAVAPTYNPMTQGIKLPEQPLGYVKFTDFKKLVEKDEVRLTTILANLLFSAHNLHSQFRFSDNAKRHEQNIENFVSYSISDNINRKGYPVYFTEENITLLSREIIYATSSAFESKMLTQNYVPTNFKGFFEDSTLKIEFNKTSWHELTDFCETISVQSQVEPNIFMDTVVCTLFDYYTVDKLILSSHFMGVGSESYFQYGGKKVKFYARKETLKDTIPAWLSFILKQYL